MVVEISHVSQLLQQAQQAMAQTTSGIEPIFMPMYKRRRKVNPNDAKTRIDFVDENGDSWKSLLFIIINLKLGWKLMVIQYTKNIHLNNWIYWCKSLLIIKRRQMMLIGYKSKDARTYSEMGRSFD